MSDVVLYDYWRSSASYRVRIALNLASIAYETVPVNLLTKDHKSSAHLARNPQGLVPAIFIDGHLLTQSLSIIEYISETRNTGFLPESPIERAQVRALAHAIAMDIHPICNLSVANHVAELVGDADKTTRAWMHKFVGSGLAALEIMLQRTNGPFCFGDRPTLADICLVPQVYNARRWDIDLTAMPRILGIETELGKIKAFAQSTPQQPA